MRAGRGAQRGTRCTGRGGAIERLCLRRAERRAGAAAGVRRQACSNRLETPFRNGVARIFENADQSLARLWQDHSNGLGTARPVSRSLTLLVPYPVPRCASSGKGHSHAATVKLTLSCSPSWGDPEKPVSRRPLTGAQVTGDTPPDERMSGQRAAPLLSFQYVIPGQDPKT